MRLQLVKPQEISLLALEQADAERDEKGALLSHLTHELRQPLTVLFGMADLLKESQLSPDQREMVGMIHRGVERLMGVVDNAADFAKLEAGNMTLERRPFAVRDCVEESLELVAAAAAEKGVELGYFMDWTAPSRVAGDEARLGQILLHLLNHAVKSTSAGQVTVTLHGTAMAETHEEIRFAVRDTGAGIPPEKLDAVFQLGDCLGLSIARRLVEMMGGRIWVESTVGSGTTFHFTIPVEPVSDNGVAVPSPALQGKRLLVVDGNGSVSRLLVDTVTGWGVEAEARHDAAEAIDLLGQERFDAVLLDGRLPDRRSFISAIRRLPGGDALPLVLLTSLATTGLDEALAGRGGRARFAAYLTKPVKYAKLQEVLAKVMAGSAGASEPRPRRPLRSRQDITVEPTSQPVPLGELAGVRVVIADDDATMRELLERVLCAEGVQVVSVGDGAAAVEAVRRHEPDVVLLDVTMPGMNGMEVCSRLKNDEATRLTPVVLITGLNSKEDRIRGIDAGADDVLTKPWERSELLARVRSLARLKRFTRDLDRVEAVLVAMARCLESRDPDTHGHCERLSDYASRLGQRIGLGEEDLNALRLAGIVHDIGKIAVPDAILFKPGPLNDQEWAVIREHPAEGERICGSLSAFRRVVPVIRHHHERLDGSGYPDRLCGDQIPVTARVLQIVDIYDALTTKRHYKPAMSPTEALQVLQSEVNRGWRDERIFNAFADLILEELGAGAGAT